MSRIITTGPFTGLLKNGYRAVEIDPPWIWKSYSKKGETKSPNAHYDTMTISDIADLPVADLLADDCAVFLWCTWPTMPAPWDVAKAWGLKYSGLAWEWVKFNPATGKYAFGGGLGGTRKNLEPCLLFRKGSPELLDRSVRDFIIDPVTGEEIIDDSGGVLLSPRRRHSEKPTEAKERIEKLFAGPYLELFSRTSRDGWDSWGDEAGKFDPPRIYTEVDDLV